MAISKRRLQPNKKGDITVSKFDNKIKTLDEALARFAAGCKAA